MFALLIGFGACGPDKIDAAIAEMKSFEVRMCACEDAACAVELGAEYKAWRVELDIVLSDEERANTPGDKLAEAEQIHAAFRRCQRVHESVAQWSKLRDEMCNCLVGDLACAQRVSARLDHIKVTDAPDFKKIQPIVQHFGQCMTYAFKP